MVIRTHINPCLDCLCAVYLMETSHGRPCRVEFIRGDLLHYHGVIQHPSCMKIYRRLPRKSEPATWAKGTVVHVDFAGKETGGRRLMLASYCHADGMGTLPEGYMRYGSLKHAIDYARDATLVDSMAMYRAFKFLAGKIIFSPDGDKILRDLAYKELIKSGIIKDGGLVE